MPANTDGAAAAPDLSDIEAAARRIAGHAQRTPLLAWPELDRRLGLRAFVKPEDAPRSQIDNTPPHGAAVTHYARYRPDREAIARAIARRMWLTGSNRSHSMKPGTT